MTNLAALLEQEASADIEAILSEARSRASEIIAKAKEEADALVNQRKRTVSSQHEAAMLRARSSAQLEAASMRLKAQHQAVESVFAEAKQELQALTKNAKKYAAVFAALFDEAAESVGGVDKVAEVTVNPADKDLLAKTLPKGAKVHTSEALTGGVKLRGADSNVTVENTLTARLESLQDELASEVSKLLFKQDQAA